MIDSTELPHRSNAGDARATWLERARTHLRNADPVLARIIDRDPSLRPRAWLDELPPMDLFGAALFQVTGGQLSVPATRRTIGRIMLLFDGRLPSPSELLAVEPIQLRAAGLSRQKMDTLRDLAERMSDGRLDEDVVLPGVALRTAIRDAYELDRLPSEAEVLALAEEWRPYRSLATSYLLASAFSGDDVKFDRGNSLG